MFQNPEYSEDSPSQSFQLPADSSIPAAVTLTVHQARQDGQHIETQTGLPFVARSMPKRRQDDKIPAYMPRVALSTPLPLSRDIEDRITSLGPVRHPKAHQATFACDLLHLSTGSSLLRTDTMQRRPITSIDVPDPSHGKRCLFYSQSIDIEVGLKT